MIQWIEKKSPVPGNTFEEKKKCDYVSSGLVDSFGILELIVEIEKVFSLRFTSGDLEDPRFKNVGGLIQIVESKIEPKEK